MRAGASPVRLAVCGAAGRMGQRILALAESDARFQIVAGVERPGNPAIGTFTFGRAPVVGDVREVLAKADAVIDFTAPESVLKTAHAVARGRRALVIGTTGLPAAAERKIKALARRIPIVYSPNMSLGVNVLFKLVETAAKSLPGYDIEIVEAHHNLKKDAPSGTALRLANVAAGALNRTEKDFVYGRKGQTGARTKREIGVLAVRAGDIVGDHTVYLSKAGERLELVHRAHSRDAFAAGALDAARWAAGRRPGLYGMADVLGL